MAKWKTGGEACRNCAEKGGDAECSCEPPAWDGMPAPRQVIVLSWEDAWVKLRDVLGRRPTRDEVKSVFKEAAQHMDDALIEDYWIYLEYLAENRSGRGGEL